MTPLDRLSADDLAMLLLDDAGWPGDIGAVAFLDPSNLIDPDGRLRLDEIRTKIAGRLHLVPRFRQVLRHPRLGLGWPYWVDVHTLDIAAHVGAVEVASPGDETELLAACEALRHRPFDPTRPLWRMTFLTGLAHGGIALYMRLHHAVADGVAGVATLGAFVDLDPDAPDPEPAPWTPRPQPSAAEVFFDNVGRRIRELRRTLTALLHPIRTVTAFRQAWPAIREPFAEKAIRTSLNRRIGCDRRYAFIRGNLGVFKRVAHVHGGKVNDVLMAALAGGLRELLQQRGEPVDGVVLRAFVPISLARTENEGNKDGSMIVHLPVGESDPVRRLEMIAAETAVQKQRVHPSGGALFRNIPIQRTFLKLAPRQKFVNFYAANVPGPPLPIYIAGAAVRELFPIVPITTNITIGVGALSYAGQFNITIVGDRDSNPDLDVLVRGVEDAVRELTATAGNRAA